MEYFIIHVLWPGVVGLDRAFQRSPRSLIHDYQRLVDEPVDLLSFDDVVIKPRRLYTLAILFAGLLTLLACVPAESLWFSEPRRGARHSETYWGALGIFAICCFAVLFFVLNHFLRGAQMVLRKNGVVIRHRRDRIYMPWSLFAWASNPEPLNESNCSLIVRSDTVAWMVHSRDNVIVAIGQDIRTWPVSFKSNGKIVFKSMFKAKLLPLVEMLKSISWKLKQEFTAPLPIGPGMEVPVDMT